MILKLAWRNIWRSRTRSLVIMSAIIIGVAATVFIMAFIAGQMQSFIANTIKNEISHIQIHHPEYKEEFDVSLTMPNIQEQLSKISKLENTQAATSKTIANGIISSAKASRGIMIAGIDPEEEKILTQMNQNIIEGDYLSDKKRNPILIGKRLADKLKVGIRKKLVLRFQDKDGEIIDAAFRIVGIFQTSRNNFDEGTVFVRQPDLNKLLNIEDAAHKIAILLKDEQVIAQDKEKIQSLSSGLLVETYEEISPEVRLFKSQIDISAKFIMTIIMLALFFGIINTMLMAVLERYRELGMLMSVGMNKVRVFSMIVLETFLIGLISAPIGMLVGYVAIQLTAKNGIDLSAYSEGMSEFGMSSIVYPALSSNAYMQVAIAVLITTILASAYPAYKAIKLRPVEAIRKI